MPVTAARGSVRFPAPRYPRQLNHRPLYLSRYFSLFPALISWTMDSLLLLNAIKRAARVPGRFWFLLENCRGSIMVLGSEASRLRMCEDLNGNETLDQEFSRGLYRVAKKGNTW